MNTKQRTVAGYLLVICLVITGCKSEQSSGTVATPSAIILSQTPTTVATTTTPIPTTTNPVPITTTPVYGGFYIKSDNTYYQNILPQDWLASENGTARYRLDIETSTSIINSCPYTGGHTLYNTRENVNVKITDLVENQIVSQMYFSGRNAQYCPDQYEFTTETTTVLVSRPDNGEIIAWLNSVMSPLGFSLLGQVKSNIVSSISEDGTPFRILKGHEGFVTSVVFSPDGKTLASGSQDSLVILWDPASGQAVRTFHGHTGEVDSVSFSPDGTRLVSGSFVGPAILWDVASGLPLSILNTGPTELSVSFSPDGTTLVTGSTDGTVTLWDAISGQVLRTLKGTVTYAKCLAFSPDGKTVAIGDLDFGKFTSRVVLWNVSQGVVLGSLKPDGDSLTRSVAFSPDGKILAIGRDDSISLWNVATRKALPSPDESGVNSVAFSPDGNILAFGASQDRIILWNVTSRQIIRTLVGKQGVIDSLAFSPDGKTLAAGTGDGLVLLWDIASLQSP